MAATNWIATLGSLFEIFACIHSMVNRGLPRHTYTYTVRCYPLNEEKSHPWILIHLHLYGVIHQYHKLPPMISPTHLVGLPHRLGADYSIGVVFGLPPSSPVSGGTERPQVSPTKSAPRMRRFGGMFGSSPCRLRSSPLARRSKVEGDSPISEGASAVCKVI